MSSELTIVKVGGGVITLSANVGQKGAPYFDGDASLIELGHRFANGEADQGTFTVLDPSAEIAAADFSYNLPAHKIITWTVDDPGFACWLFRGRTQEYEGGRGHAVADNFVEFDVTALDINRDLRFQAFTEEWVRPVETDVARLVALDAYTLSGASSTAADHGDDFEITISTTHLAPNTNTVTMPAKTYEVGTQPQDVIQDCADASGKVYGVVRHHTGGSHACLRYHLETDHSVDPSPIKISDNLADWDPEDPSAPVYEPHWESGKATLFAGGQLLSGLVCIGQFGSVVSTIPGNVTSYGYAVEAYYDPTSTTTAQAQVVCDGVLAKKAYTHLTHRVSIIMLASQLALVAEGQSLEIKAAAAIGGQYLDIYQIRRVAQCRFEPRLDGTYWAHLELDRATVRKGQSPGKTQPKSTTPKPPPVCLVPDPGGIGAPVAGISKFCETGGVADACGPWSDTVCWNGTSESFTTYSAISPGNYYSEVQIATKYGGSGPWVFRVLMRDLAGGLPNKSVQLDSVSMLQCRAGQDWTTASGTFEVPAGYDEIRFGLIGPGGKAFLQGSHEINEYTEPAAAENDPNCVNEGDAGDSPYFAPSDDPRFNNDDQHLISRLSQRVINNSGATLEAGDVVIPDITFDGEAVIRTTTASTTASMVGVVLEGAADDQSVVVLWQGVTGFVNDGASTSADGDYLYTSTTAGAANVSATRTTGAVGRVVRDLSGDPLYVLWWGVPDAGSEASLTEHGDLLGLADNDHPQYRLTTDGGQDVISVVAASGSTETLSLANGNVHDVTLTANCTLTLTGATTGVECTMALLLRQDGTGSRTVTWPASVEWVGGSAPTLETAANAWNWVTLTTLNGGTVWFGDAGTATSISADDVRDAGIWEVIVSGTAPPVATTNAAEDDWVYGWVSG